MPHRQLSHLGPQQVRYRVGCQSSAGAPQILNEHKSAVLTQERQPSVERGRWVGQSPDDVPRKHNVEFWLNWRRRSIADQEPAINPMPSGLRASLLKHLYGQVDTSEKVAVLCQQDCQ
ncbi:MAG: hypothetical protein JWM76_1053 [Pseudonocardiales bacterium]|nr:hypothetical protein [Pseudonocardiales bacterium]